ncbi:MAG: type II toxin-antitoxin system Phd/YefM family antitoxin [Robiginitomaculum sp.]|nr:type II toxin-antitoxin system Phd/YefM family antitoxin [Robiginitomaculum sp.]
MRTVPATEFSKNFGRYRDIVQREPVAVTNHDRISGYFISGVEYEAYLKLKPYLPKPYGVEELSDDTLQALADSKMDKRHAHLNHLLED